MNFNDATEQAYKNGYEKGFKDCFLIMNNSEQYKRLI